MGLCPGTRIPGLGTGIGTDSPGTLGTGRIIAGTVPGHKSCFSKNFEIPGPSLELESQAVPRILPVAKSSHGTQIPGTLGTGTKIFGTGSPVPCLVKLFDETNFL